MVQKAEQKQSLVTLEEELLDEESKEFASWLFAWKPDWKTFAQMAPEPNGVFSLFVELKSPTGDSDRNLILNVAKGPSLFFHLWHTHLDILSPFANSALNADIEEFKRLVSGIISDSLVLIIDLPDENVTELISYENQDELAEILTEPGNGERFEMISFNGTRDRIIQID